MLYIFGAPPSQQGRQQGFGLTVDRTIRILRSGNYSTTHALRYDESFAGPCSLCGRMGKWPEDTSNPPVHGQQPSTRAHSGWFTRSSCVALPSTNPESNKIHSKPIQQPYNNHTTTIQQPHNNRTIDPKGGAGATPRHSAPRRGEGARRPTRRAAPTVKKVTPRPLR